MSVFMLVHLRIARGKKRLFEEALTEYLPILEGEGWKLRGAWEVRLGDLDMVYDFWEMPDASHVMSVLEKASQNPASRHIGAKIAECVLEEKLEILTNLSYSPMAYELT